jgi:two-component system, LytTR family, sensor kinase
MRSVSLTRRNVLMPLALAGCWFFWMAVGGIGWAFKAPNNLTYVVRYTLVDGVTGFLFCGLLFLLYDRVRRRVGFRPFVFAAVGLSAVFAIGWHAVSGVAMWALGWSNALYLTPKNLLIGGGLMDGITLVLFSVVFVAVDHWLQFGEQREKAREATALAHQAQLQMLRYQINPHFLFNALNSIRAMIVENPGRAREIVTELAEFMRYSLNGRGHESTIGEEIQAIENYLAIQRMRFEERLEVSMRIDPVARAIVVPCFLIHPLVENAVKYGMETSPTPLRLEIDVAPRGADLIVRVSNTGRLLFGDTEPAAHDPRNGTGTGLRNVRQRLELAFPGRHAFTVAEADSRVVAEIVLHDVVGARAP